MLILWLLSMGLLDWWFVWVVVTGIGHLGRDPGGSLVFQSPAADHVFYPFTLAAALLSLLGVAGAVAFRERGSRWAVPLGLLVGFVSTVGMINVYEQVFVAALETSTGSVSWWAYYWGGANGIGTLLGLLGVAAVLPWVSRRNLRPAFVVLGIFLLGMLIWFAVGFPPVTDGSPTIYALNAATRLLSQGMLVLLVLPEEVRAHLHRWGSRIPGWGKAPGTSESP